MKFKSYTHFKNYCLKIAKNNEYIVNKDELETFEKFENVVSTLETLQNENVIKLNNDILDKISSYFKVCDFKTAFSRMDYFINKLHSFSKGKQDFYYVTTSLNSMLGLDVEFEEDFILRYQSIIPPFYPSKIRGLEIKEIEDKIYTINEIDLNYKDKYGVYFIYNYNGELVYIGKSISCLLTRALSSAKERGCLNFSKIELRECKHKSDVAIYEAYYIALHKPEHNKDLMFDDSPSITLPELGVSKEIVRDIGHEYVTYKYTYYKSRVMEIQEFVNLAKKGKALIATTKNIEYLENKGIYSQYEMQHQAYADSLQQIKSSGQYTIPLCSQINLTSI